MSGAAENDFREAGKKENTKMPSRNRTGRGPTVRASTLPAAMRRRDVANVRRALGSAAARRAAATWGGTSRRGTQRVTRITGGSIGGGKLG